MSEVENEKVQLLAEIRDQLKRLADMFQSVLDGNQNFNVEIGTPTIRVKGPNIE